MDDDGYLSKSVLSWIHVCNIESNHNEIIIRYLKNQMIPSQIISHSFMIVYLDEPSIETKRPSLSDIKDVNCETADANVV